MRRPAQATAPGIPATVEKAIEKYRLAIDRAVRRDVDAAATGSRFDWQRAEAADETVEAAEAELRLAIVHAIGGGS